MTPELFFSKKSISGWRILGVTRSLAGSRTPKVWAVAQPTWVRHAANRAQEARRSHDAASLRSAHPRRECRIHRDRAAWRARRPSPELPDGWRSASTESGRELHQGAPGEEALEQAHRLARCVAVGVSTRTRSAGYRPDAGG